ncbi:hypothetical protein KBT16_32945, partial [Nostoc sp. CCCryo 231-06]|nr:hypothetical protein [Nostoc sp. CCCryo 231-06]
ENMTFRTFIKPHNPLRSEALEALYVMKSPQEWDRFMRFMERYAEENDLGLSKNEA